jgi:chemotaxis protein CheD
MNSQFATNVYYDRTFDCNAAKILPGEYYYTERDMLIVTVLGSCVSACIRDRVTGLGGMNHFMLPDGGDTGPVSASMRYGSYAMEVLINDLLKAGARRDSLEAKVFGGGAVISGMNSINVGERNTSFVMDYLKTERIPVVSKDVLDVHPRKVCFFPASGKAMVKRLAATNTEALVAQDRAAAHAPLPAATAGGSIDLF